MSDNKSEVSSEHTTDTNDDIFEYEIEVPATTAIIRLDKNSIYEIIEDRLERKLSKEERKKAWEEFSTHEDFWGMFPDDAWNHGVRMYGASNEHTYAELFQENVEKAIQDSIDDTMTELWDNIFQQTLDDVTRFIRAQAKEEETDEDSEPEMSNTVIYPTLPASPQAEQPENENKYIEFLKEQHPLIKAMNPDMTPQQIIEAIGHKWSLEQMTIGIKKGNLFIKHKMGNVTIDSCGKPDELKAFLEAYRNKNGHKTFLEFVKKIGTYE